MTLKIMSFVLQENRRLHTVPLDPIPLIHNKNSNRNSTSFTILPWFPPLKTGSFKPWATWQVMNGGISNRIMMVNKRLPSLKLTAKAPENGWQRKTRPPFLLGIPIFRGYGYVSFRECDNKALFPGVGGIWGRGHTLRFDDTKSTQLLKLLVWKKITKKKHGLPRSITNL